jgi:hypothetical protein
MGHKCSNTLDFIGFKSQRDDIIIAKCKTSNDLKIPEG